MVKMVDSINSVKKVNQEYYTSVQAVPPVQKDVEDRGIFAEQGLEEDFTSLVNASLLEDQLHFVQKEQGSLMKGWDNLKGAIGVGASSEKCEDAIDKYKNGEISFEEAMGEIENFYNKQSSSLDLFSNIATGITAIVAGTAVAATGGAAAPIVAGALVGAGTKAGFKATDRATNDIKGDALDGKQLAKDALSGALTGGIAVATAGTAGKPFAAGGTKACVTKCASTGFKTGALSGASNYTIDCAFDENKDFNVKDFAVNTATSSVVGGTVGAIMGGVNGTLRANNLLSHGGSVVEANTTSDIVANSVCSTEYKLLNSGIRNIAA